MSVFDLGNASLVAPQGWMQDAACADLPTSVFFPGRHGDPDRAKAICAGCEVSVQCLDWALMVESGGKWDRSGIFGGLTPVERAEIGSDRGRRRPRRANAA